MRIRNRCDSPGGSAISAFVIGVYSGIRHLNFGFQPAHFPVPDFPAIGAYSGIRHSSLGFHSAIFLPPIFLPWGHVSGFDIWTWDFPLHHLSAPYFSAFSLQS